MQGGGIRHVKSLWCVRVALGKVVGDGRAPFDQCGRGLSVGGRGGSFFFCARPSGQPLASPCRLSGRTAARNPFGGERFHVSTPSKSESSEETEAEQFYGLCERSRIVGVRLTRQEQSLLAESAGGNQDLRVTRKKFILFSQQKWHKDIEREAFLSAIEQPSKEKGTLGRWLLPVIGYVGTASYAIAGTQVAGEAGMNIVGCCFVGGVSALGGGAVNAMLFGYARHGVPWATDPRNLMVAVLASLLTFFLWPILSRSIAEERVRSIQDMAKSRSWWTVALHRAGLAKPIDGITRAEFVKACEASKEDSSRTAFDKRIRKVLMPVVRAKLPGLTEPTADQLFDLIDLNQDGVLDVHELERLVLMEYHNSASRYAIDTVALGASAVNGPAMAISRGLHPVVCAVSGVTICFGGILRDLICDRPVALGGQSFAASTAAGSLVYVGLRELCLLGYSLPLPLRVALSSCTTVTVRVLDYWADGMLLPPMHGRPAINVSSSQAASTMGMLEGMRDFHATDEISPRLQPSESGNPPDVYQ